MLYTELKICTVLWYGVFYASVIPFAGPVTFDDDGTVYISIRLISYIYTLFVLLEYTLLF